MYSRIIELSDRRLSPEERMTRFDVPDWFFDSVADYVAQTEASRKDVIDWFMGSLNGAAALKDEDTLIFSRNAMRRYFAHRFETFTEQLHKLEGISEDDFVGLTGNADSLMDRLNEIYCDRYSVYVYCSSSDCYISPLLPLDLWMRTTDLSRPFYFGGTVCYHC